MCAATKNPESGDRVKIVLGLDADGLSYPTTPDGAKAEAGALVTGPSGLLRVVEASLGLGRPPTPAARRLAAWRAKLALADGPSRFWHASFVTDPFATARMLLDWRDSLVSAGWSADKLQNAPQRLADLAAAEIFGPPVPPGEADRLMLAIQTLRDDPPPSPIVAELRLLDRHEDMPPGLRALIDALAAAGTSITPVAMPSHPTTGDLGAARNCLIGAAVHPIQADGSFTLLEAETEGAAAEVVADLIAASPDREQLVVLATRPTTVLDAALRRRHLPRLGLSSQSPLRGILQILPLTFAVRWQPFDARRMLELLQLPNCPIPREVRDTLQRLLPDTPGRGGPKWTDAIATGLASWRKRLRNADPSSAKARIREGEAAEKLWLETPLADPEAGLPLAELVEACSWLVRWAGRLASQDVPLAGSLAAYALSLSEAAQETGLANLKRLDLERLIDAVLAEGEADAGAPAEATAWHVATAPGAVWGPVRRLVWWGFDLPPLPDRSPWSADEQRALEAAGCLPWKPEIALAAASQAWRRPILAAQDSVLLVAIRPSDAVAHPLAHELEPLLAQNPSLRPRAEALCMEARPRIGGIALPRAAIAPLNLPVPRAEWRTNATTSVRRDVDSASAIETLLGCPFSWTMQYRAGARAGRFAQIADDERLIGLLAHALAAELFQTGQAAWNPEDLTAAATLRLETLIQEAAAPLSQPGAAGQLVRVKERLPQAMAAIGRLLSEGGFTVVETEATREATDLPEHGEHLSGQIDMLLRDGSGLPALLDLKWTRAPRRYHDRLAAGNAIQLAAYSQLTKVGERAAYLLLADAYAVGPNDGLTGAEVVAQAPRLTDTWAAVRQSRAARAVTLGNGILRALGVFDGKNPPPDPDGAPIAPEAPCRFCDYGRLCGKEAVA